MCASWAPDDPTPAQVDAWITGWWGQDAYEDEPEDDEEE